MTEVEIICHHIEGVGRRLGYRLADVGFPNVNDEELNRKVEELNEELDMRTVSDGEVVATVELGCGDAP